MSDQVGDALIYALLLILPLSALAARRLPLGTTVRYALAWVAIFAVMFLLVLLYQRLTATPEPVWRDMVGIGVISRAHTARYFT